MSVLPVTKVQFERYLAEPDGLSSSWYGKVAELNPRVAAVSFPNATREGLFMTGVTFDEAKSYATWVDPDGRIPQDSDWREFARRVQSKQLTTTVHDVLMNCGMSPTAKAMLDRLIQFERPKTLADLCLIRHGVFEWVNSVPEPGGLGSPRNSFFSNTFDPYHDPVLKHFSPERSAIHGFRVMIDPEVT